MRSYVDQVGGDHYGGGYGIWDYCADAHVLFLEGNAAKYISRYRKKAGVEDLLKGLSYIDKLLTTLSPHCFRVDNSYKYSTYWHKFCANHKDLTPHEISLLFQIFNWKNVEDLKRVKIEIQKLIKETTK